MKTEKSIIRRTKLTTYTNSKIRFPFIPFISSKPAALMTKIQYSPFKTFPPDLLPSIHYPFEHLTPEPPNLLAVTSPILQHPFP